MEAVEQLHQEGIKESINWLSNVIHKENDDVFHDLNRGGCGFVSYFIMYELQRKGITNFELIFLDNYDIDGDKYVANFKSGDGYDVSPAHCLVKVAGMYVDSTGTYKTVKKYMKKNYPGRNWKPVMVPTTLGLFMRGSLEEEFAWSRNYDRTLNAHLHDIIRDAFNRYIN